MADARSRPTTPSPTTTIGPVWKDKGDFNRAIADYGKAIGLNPSYTAAYTNSALVYERIGDLARVRDAPAYLKRRLHRVAGVLVTSNDPRSWRARP